MRMVLHRHRRMLLTAVVINDNSRETINELNEANKGD